MLLLFKTNDCLRHAERQLDAGVDSFLITLRHCLRAMVDAPRDAAAEHDGLRAALHRMRLRLALWLLRLVSEGAAADAVRRMLLA